MKTAIRSSMWQMAPDATSEEVMKFITTALLLGFHMSVSVADGTRDDFAMLKSWSNPLTDADVCMEIVFQKQYEHHHPMSCIWEVNTEFRDHDGDGDMLEHSIRLDGKISAVLAESSFNRYVREQTEKYEAGLEEQSQRLAGISRKEHEAEFKQWLDTEVHRLQGHQTL